MGTIFLDVQPQSEAGDFARLVHVSVECGGTARGKLSIPVELSVRPRIEIHPSRLSLGSGASGSTSNAACRSASNDGSNFRVTSVATKSGPVRAGRSFSEERCVEVDVDLSFVVPDRNGVHRGELEICVEGETRSHLVLPVSVVVGPQ